MVDGSDVSEGQPKVSVILPVRDGEPYLAFQLAAIERQRCSFPWEVIVVDNGSSDGSKDTARSFLDRIPNLKVLSEPVAGKSRALNRAIQAASGQHLVFVDADDEMAPRYVEQMSRGLDRYEIVAGIADTETLNEPRARAGMLEPFEIPVYLNFRPGFPGGVTGIRSSARQAVGDYDEEIYCAEDVDFSWRAQALGLSFGRAPRAIMHVRRPPGTLDTFRKFRGYGRGSVRLYERYRSQGLRRRSLRQICTHLWRGPSKAFSQPETWKWTFVASVGDLFGRLEESIRRRVFFP